MRAWESCKVGICMGNSAVAEHVKLCISTIPAETENKWRLAGSEDEVEQIPTLCHPENFSITQSCLWKQLYGKFSFNKRMPVWKKWHSHPWSCGRCTSRLAPLLPLLGQRLSQCLSWPRATCALLQPFTGHGSHKDLQNEVQHPLTDRLKNPPCFCTVVGTQSIGDRSWDTCLLLHSVTDRGFISSSLADLVQGQPKRTLQLLLWLLIRIRIYILYTSL